MDKTNEQMVGEAAQMTDGCIVIGGGLAGLVCAHRLADKGRLAYLIDTPVNGFGRSLGGFAEFSGAKFSLPPAGLGLVGLAGGNGQLEHAISQVVELLGLNQFNLSSSSEIIRRGVPAELNLRGYQSYVLSTHQISDLIKRLSSKIPQAKVARSRVANLTRTSSGKWQIDTDDGGRFAAKTVIMAAGRGGASLLAAIGAAPQLGKGLDVGVRLEFDDVDALSNLRLIGADAKVLYGTCRTFCLNSPGRIFHYVTEGGIAVPGGIVADAGEMACNVGLLARVKEKQDMLGRLHSRLGKTERTVAGLKYVGHKRRPIDAHLLTPLFGDEVVASLQNFAQHLFDEGLIKDKYLCTVHYPLIDWHWPVFALPGSFATTVEDVLVIGDLAGHARGLLQSAVSGWLAAEKLV